MGIKAHLFRLNQMIARAKEGSQLRTSLENKKSML